MAIDFPVVNSDPSLPWLNPDTGITYIYKDGAWRVLSSSDFEDLEDIYVNVSGDTMTGQLTLPGGGTGAQAIQVQEVETLIGNIDSTDYVSKTDTNSQNIVSDLTLDTDKITLDATEGSAEFAGQIAFQRPTDGGPSFSIGYDLVNFDGIFPDTSKCGFINRSNGGSSFYAGFTSNVPSNHFGIWDTTNKEITIQLNVDGSAEFAGAIVGKSSISSGLTGDGGSTGSQGFWLAGQGGNSHVSRFSRNTNGDGAVLTISSRDRPDVIEFNANGSAQFKGFVESTNGSAQCALFPDGTAAISGGIYFQDANLIRFLTANGPVGSGSGTLYFGNARLQTTTFYEIWLEPDNEDNYVTTTDVDEEGNTVENRVYNGPTLDVKERLLNLVARLDAIEANEVVDDATDNSLLLAVAELTSRLNERDALITTLTTRIEALENA